jgi:hypothetical protein
MSESKHTPGPWRASYDRQKRRHSFVGDGMWFANVSWTVISDRNEADAHLIAAAPDLLDWLKSIVADHDTGHGVSLASIGHARVAIAKAEGRS